MENGMKPCLLIVGIFVVGTQLQAMESPEVMTPESAQKANTMISVQERVIVTLKKMVADLMATKDKLKAPIFEGKDKYVDRAQVRKYIEAEQELLKQQTNLVVNQCKLSALKQAKLLFERVDQCVVAGQKADAEIIAAQQRAKKQEDALMAENGAIVKSLSEEGHVNKQEILRLMDNIEKLQKLYNSTSDDLSQALRQNAKLRQQLKIAQPQPSAWTRFMNYLRGKKSATEQEVPQFKGMK